MRCEGSAFFICNLCTNKNLSSSFLRQFLQTVDYFAQIKKRPERSSRHKRKQTESLSRGFTLSFTGNANPHDVFQPDSTKQKKVEEESSEKRSPLA